MILLWLLMAVDPGCPDDSSLSDVRTWVATIAKASTTRDIAAFTPAYGATMQRVACLTEVIQPRDAAAIHAATYLNDAVSNDKGSMAFSLRAMMDVPNGGGAPTWLSLPDGAEIANSSAWVSVQAPEHVALFVDGVPMHTRPLDRPAIYQAVGPGAEVLWTHYLQGDQELPAGFTLSEPVANGGTVAGRELLDDVTTLLSDGAFREVLELSMPAIATYPELADSFRAAADLAADQLERERNPVPVSEFGILGPSPGYRARRRGAVKRNDDRKGVLLGFEVGLPTALRAEWKIGGAQVDSVGARVGGTLLIAGSASAYTGTDVNVYTDINLIGRFQLELITGVLVSVDGSPYVTAGVAAQYDPPSPLQVNLGVRLASSGYVSPELSVGFLW